MRLAAWQCRDVAPGTGRADDVAEDWLPIAAPGDTYLALHAAGRLPHPHAHDHEIECAWVEHREWWWRAAFDLPPATADERIQLVFQGLDTLATIWVNGTLIGESANMFAGRVFDIGASLRGDAPNDLRIRFTPPEIATAGRAAPFWDVPDDHPIKGSKRNLIRKAQFGWGWDWAPRLPTVGIWQPVQIDVRCVAAIRDVRFETLSVDNPARVAVTVEVDRFAGAAEATIELRDPAGVLVANVTGDGRHEIEIANAQLWWTPEFGAAALYTLTTILRGDAGAIDRREQQVGIRTLALDMSADPQEPGCDFFRFVLNGVPIFARGACWVPASSFVGAVTAAEYDALLDLAAQANMNMVRVWGGGVYESNAFYDACDRRGLLVWQDLMFACAPYPEDDPAFVEQAALEVQWQARRLRNHACLALWCGNNEGQVIQEIMNARTGTAHAYLGDRLFRETIPALLAELDPATPYWPGSPSGGPAQNSMRAGDVHNWTVWHGLPPVIDDVVDGTFDRSPEGVAYTRYAEDMGRFVSEFGLMSAPALATFKRWVAPDQLALDSPGLLHRIKDRPFGKIEALLAPNTGLPATIVDYVNWSQIMQAEGLKFGIEHYRRRKPHCSGALLWQFNDCWPGVSWSIVDGDRVPKPAWHAVRRAFAPVMASFRDAGDGVIELWVTNDTLTDVAIDGSVRLVSLDGREIDVFALRGTARANASGMLWQGRPAAAPNHVLLARSTAFADNRHFFAPLKHVPFTFAIDVERGADHLTISALRYAYGVGLYSDNPSVRFSDNFFDLAAGEERIVKMAGTTPLSIAVRPTYDSKTRNSTNDD